MNYIFHGNVRGEFERYMQKNIREGKKINYSNKKDLFSAYKIPNSSEQSGWL
jgi:hypothetical protein